MSVSQKFLTNEGLMPSTIFDRDPDMDVSEEMEEIREILYALIKKNFPMGVSSTHLAEKYTEEYVSIGLGRPLPSDWLEQVTAAEEFEAQVRGPLTILFVRLNNTSSFKRPQIPNTNVKIITSGSSVSSGPQPMIPLSRSQSSPISMRKSPHDLAKQFQFCVLDLDWTTSRDVIVSHISPTTELWVTSSENATMNRLNEKMNEWYGQNEGNTVVQTHEVCSNGAYAVQDERGNWLRAVAISSERDGSVQFLLVDSGKTVGIPVEKIRFLTCPQADTPSLAARCSLDLPHSLVSEDTVETLRGMLMDKDSQNGWKSKVVKACLLSVSDGKSARRICMFLTDGRNIKDEIMEMSSPGKENQGHQTTSVRPPPPQPASLPSPASSQSLPSSFSCETEIEPMQPVEMPLKPCTAHALFAAGPADISLRLSSLDPMPDYMYQRLTEDCESQGAQLTETPKQGKMYAAMIDERWERVICVRSSKIDPSAFCVYLVDIGAFHYVRGDSMRLLNSKTPFKKMLMFKAKVAGIAPIGGQDVWTRESHLAVREFFEACQGEPVEVVAQPVPVVPRGASPPGGQAGLEAAGAWTKWKQLNAPCVPLVEARISCGGRDLADWLIACGLAVPIPLQ